MASCEALGGHGYDGQLARQEKYHPVAVPGTFRDCSGRAIVNFCNRLGKDNAPAFVFVAVNARTITTTEIGGVFDKRKDGLDRRSLL